MKNILVLTLTLSTLIACSTEGKKKDNSSMKIAFGSCNNQALENLLWDDIAQQKPEVFVWGGDIIYSDTEDMTVLKANYEYQKNKPEYQKFIDEVEVLGTWDDHDYGINDGGAQYSQKWASQQLFLDFFDVADNDPRRLRKGVYHQKDFQKGQHQVKVIILDTRYWRSDLTDDPSGEKRYLKDSSPEKTMLGAEQWAWLEQTLKASNADFNILISSVQYLSGEHGFESWENFPLEAKKLEKILVYTQAKNPIILSGDRHISEFSIKDVQGLKNPLVDFTSSGMTHYYEGFSGEENPYRTGEVILAKDYGLLTIDFDTMEVLFQSRGDQGEVFEELKVNYTN